MTKGWAHECALTIAVFDEVGNSGAACVSASLAAEIAAGFAKRDERPLSIVARDGDAIAGGLNGATHWGWCYIRQLWVQAAWRRRGLGRRLLEEAEMLAQSRGCGGLYVDTFDPRAALFYERAGFVAFGRIEGFPPGHARIFLQKRFCDVVASASPDETATAT
jgi:GNAT superfamily N-acetyltransferase